MSSAKRALGLVVVSTWAGLLLTVEPAVGATLRVDRNTSNCGTSCDGSDWDAGNVYEYIQDALLDAAQDDEIWVAAGTYLPDEQNCDVSADCSGGTCPSGVCVWSSPKDQTFDISGIKLYGGFDATETSIGDRAFRCYDYDDDSYGTTSCASNNDCGLGELCLPLELTVLDGDLDGDDDFPTPTTLDDNSFHVVTAASGTIEGVTIRGGNDPGGGGHGAGLLITGGTPAITSCIITENLAYFGGAMDIEPTAGPIMDHCLFIGNIAKESGGGIYCSDGDDYVITNSTFRSNDAKLAFGGGIYNHNTTTSRLTNCYFIGNSAALDSGGGGFCNRDSTSTLVNCVFNGNTAKNGGGVGNRGTGALYLINSTFFQNTATNLSSEGQGGGLYNNTATATVENCIFWDNSSDIDNDGEAGQIKGDNITVTNSLILNYCDLGGPFDDNTGDDPQFSDADGADNIFNTGDDDLHVDATSPAIDHGDNAALPADTDDLDNDDNTTEAIPLDLDLNTRTVNVTVDIGAYEAADSDCGDDICDSPNETFCSCSDDCSGSGTEDCFDDIDNDCDGLIDCCDSECTGGSETLCADSVDNDCDGVTDCADSDCQTGTETACSDSIDNDCDGCKDSLDDDCGGTETGCFDFTDNDCDGCFDSNDSDCGGTEVACSDGIDNDCDGLTDCSDADCQTGTESACSDTIDNDCDGCTDSVDADCGGTETSCSGGTDDDCDGCTDSVDSDCGGTETSCVNRVDDDCDGLIDCADPNCNGNPACGVPK